MRTLHNQKWYTPKDVAKLGLIQSSKGDKGTVSGTYNFVLELIKSGQLEAKNYSTGTQRANWLVSETAIANYHSTVTNVGS